MANNISDIYPPFKAKIGRPLKFTPEGLLKKFEAYVEWCKKHPIKIDKFEEGFSGLNNFQRTATDTIPRLITIKGFFTFIGSADWSWWTQLSTREDGPQFVRVKEWIKNYCESYQQEMASAGVFNANIISRLLGLADKKEVEVPADSVTIVVKTAEEKQKISDIGEIGV